MKFHATHSITSMVNLEAFKNKNKTKSGMAAKKSWARVTRVRSQVHRMSAQTEIGHERGGGFFFFFFLQTTSLILYNQPASTFSHEHWSSRVNCFRLKIKALWFGLYYIFVILPIKRTKCRFETNTRNYRL